MPWETLKLNSGHDIPSIAFGTSGKGFGRQGIDTIEQALDVGFVHIDTAQSYRNENEAGEAIKESGLARSDVFVTTKWSKSGGLNVSTSIRNSLTNLNLSYVDLYLIHNPRIVEPDIPTVWSQLEEVYDKGLAKSIGVSNFEVSHLEVLLESAKIKPAVNQIPFDPYIYTRQAPILDFAAKHGIIIESYSPLKPLTRFPGGPLDQPLDEISARLGASPDQVLLAWGRAKGTVIVTSSTKKLRLEGYLDAGDITLTEEDIEAIDIAGAIGPNSWSSSVSLRAFAGVAVFFVLLAVLYRSYARRRHAQAAVALRDDED